MLFHPPKCVSLPITRSRSPLDYSYEFHGHTLVLDSVSSAKYLGITIQQDVDWDNHINNVVNKANTNNRTLGFLQRSLQISFSAIKDRAYKAFVRSILEYVGSGSLSSPMREHWNFAQFYCILVTNFSTVSECILFEII